MRVRLESIYVELEQVDVACTHIFDLPDGAQVIQVEWDREVAHVTFLMPINPHDAGSEGES